jgi:hypothetical protein
VNESDDQTRACVRFASELSPAPAVLFLLHIPDDTRTEIWEWINECSREMEIYSSRRSILERSRQAFTVGVNTRFHLASTCHGRRSRHEGSHQYAREGTFESRR